MALSRNCGAGNQKICSTLEQSWSATFCRQITLLTAGGFDAPELPWVPVAGAG